MSISQKTHNCGLMLLLYSTVDVSELDYPTDEVKMTTRVRSVERHPTRGPQRNSVICPRKPGKNQKAVGRCFTPRQPLQLRVNPLVTPVMKVLPAQEQGALRAGAWSSAGLTLQPSLSRAGHWEHDRADRPTLRHFSLRANSEFSLKSVEVLSGCGLVSLSERRRADCSSETVSRQQPLHPVCHMRGTDGDRWHSDVSFRYERWTRQVWQETHTLYI